MNNLQDEEGRKAACSLVLQLKEKGRKTFELSHHLIGYKHLIQSVKHTDTDLNI